MKNKKLIMMSIVIVLIVVVVWLGILSFQNATFYEIGNPYEAESYEEFIEIMSESGLPLPAKEDLPNTVTYFYTYLETGKSATPSCYLVRGENNEMRLVVEKISNIEGTAYAIIQYNDSLDGIPVSYSEEHIQFVWDGYFYSFHYNDVMSQEKAEEILIMLVNGGV